MTVTDIERFRVTGDPVDPCDPRNSINLARGRHGVRAVILTGDPADPIDAMLHRSHGEVLRPPPVGDYRGGEYDHVREGHVSTRDRRRMASAGLVSAGGLPADVLCDRCQFDGDASTFVEWWYAQGLKGLDHRAAARNGTRWEDRTRPDPDDDDGDAWADYVRPDPATPAPCQTGTVTASGPVPGLAAYLERLVFAEKLTYAAAYAAHVTDGAPCPDDPGTEWARKARSKVDALVRRAAA